VAECRNLKVPPHVAQNLERPGGSAIDARTTQHPGYAISQRKGSALKNALAEDHRPVAESRDRGIFKVGLGLHPCGNRLQPGPHCET
jgi:hypothetical protein